MNEQVADSSSWVERLSQFFTGEPKDRKDLLAILRDAQKRHLIDRDALSMIEGVLMVSELRVRDIMVPRAQMDVVHQDASLSDIFPIVIDTHHSRFPVIGEDRSQVVGILLAKDLLPYAYRRSLQVPVKKLMRKALFVPESKRLNVMLREFRQQRQHMAIVIDEYGAAAGLVTIEDILEQIVGEIADEHDLEEEYIFRRSNKVYTVKAITPIEEFNAYFDADLSDEDFDTIGGLIVHTLGHVPQRGEKIQIDRFEFEVLRADNRRIHLLKVKLLEPKLQESRAD
ncbi:magnesium and cobalt transporter [Methylomarinovum caldicuralii]|uniref:Magnesium and cobalt efflux protein CorC n=1 Tax=Methylomarinovum caldicuralii TaxID=438856 RepID=A0AAU9C9G6_9GAMM|nr:transporter associated domain-containing protein [Methylomarinovum caldicuralii]BCX81124.1 magnesium and cobalt transporter [Methylomarinovum caldicuralii]